MYSFEIHFNPYKRVNGGLTGCRTICVSAICIYAKNNKFGQFYKSKYVEEQKGKFDKIAGSHSYPILWSKKPVILKITNFPKKPVLYNNGEYHKHIQLKNIKKQ